MLRHRTSALVALMAFSATTLALAQSTPPANSSTSPTTSPSSPKPNGDENNSAPDTQDAPAASADKSAQDPKMKACMKAEKAKNSGLDDNQLKQKCMLQIASHQGH
jgi:hypothetical protein